MHKKKSLRWIAIIIAEKVDDAWKEPELGETPTFHEVKQRFRELARKWHPGICREKDAGAAITACHSMNLLIY